MNIYLTGYVGTYTKGRFDLQAVKPNLIIVVVAITVNTPPSLFHLHPVIITPPLPSSRCHRHRRHHRHCNYPHDCATIVDLIVV